MKSDKIKGCTIVVYKRKCGQVWIREEASTSTSDMAQKAKQQKTKLPPNVEFYLRKNFFGRLQLDLTKTPANALNQTFKPHHPPKK